MRRPPLRAVPVRPSGMALRTEVLGGVGEACGHVGVDETGRDGVDRDVARRVLAAIDLVTPSRPALVAA